MIKWYLYQWYRLIIETLQCSGNCQSLTLWAEHFFTFLISYVEMTFFVALIDRLSCPTIVLNDGSFVKILCLRTCMHKHTQELLKYGDQIMLIHLSYYKEQFSHIFTSQNKYTCKLYWKLRFIITWLFFIDIDLNKIDHEITCTLLRLRF